MPEQVTLRGAAFASAVATAAAGVLLAYWGESPLPALAAVPLAVGLVGLGFRKTWGAFAALGGATLLGVAFGLDELPLFAVLLAAGAVAVAIPFLVRTFRYDASAAAVWVALASLSGGGAALAWHEIDSLEEEEQPVAPPLVKDVDAPGWSFRAWGETSVDAEAEPCRHRHRRAHRRWRYRRFR